MQLSIVLAGLVETDHSDQMLRVALNTPPDSQRDSYVLTRISHLRIGQYQ
jgi:hypothetical protein